MQGEGEVWDNPQLYGTEDRDDDVTDGIMK